MSNAAGRAPGPAAAPGLRLQLVVSLGGLFLLAFVPLFFAVASLTRATLRAEREAHARALGRVVAARVAEAQASRAPGELLSLVDAQIGSATGLYGIGVYDLRGEAIARAGDLESSAALPARITPGDERVLAIQSPHGRALSVVVPGPKGAVVALLRTDDEVARAGPLIRLVGLYTLLVAFVLLVFAYFALTRLVVQPLDALSRAARRVASGGLRFDAPTKGSRELRELAESVADMTLRLRAEEDALRAKVEELEAATSALQKAQDKLIRSERLASVGRLSAGLAHEIGNPLAAILGLQDLVIEGGLSPEEERDFVVRMRKETERIHRILRDLLDFARPAAPAPAPTPVREAGKVDEAIGDVCNLLRPQKRMRDVVLRVELAPGLPRVALGQQELVQVALNLVTNAVDALRGEGRVVVRALPEGHGPEAGVRLEVEDDGPGIDPRVASSLFEPFVTTKEVGQGTGLGLAVCRGLVEGVGGSIAALPREDGARGARLVVTLPGAHAPAAASAR